MILETLVSGLFQENSYLLGCAKTRRAAIIDPGDNTAVRGLIKWIGGHDFSLDYILLTHGHIDHIGGVADLQRRFATAVCLHRNDQVLLQGSAAQARMFDLPAPTIFAVDRWISHGDRLTVGEIELEVIETPGHTPGSVCFYLPDRDTLFSGDTLFWGSVGRTDLSGGSTTNLLTSIHQRLLTLPPQTVVYSGHGPVTTIAREKESNPFLNDAVI